MGWRSAFVAGLSFAVSLEAVLQFCISTMQMRAPADE
jgi:hypothetical protein